MKKIRINQFIILLVLTFCFIGSGLREVMGADQNSPSVIVNDYPFHLPFYTNDTFTMTEFSDYLNSSERKFDFWNRFDSLSGQFEYPIKIAGQDPEVGRTWYEYLTFHPLYYKDLTIKVGEHAEVLPGYENDIFNQFNYKYSIQPSLADFYQYITNHLEGPSRQDLATYVNHKIKGEEPSAFSFSAHNKSTIVYDLLQTYRFITDWLYDTQYPDGYFYLASLGGGSINTNV